jgi:hypothetical protein
MMRTHARTHAHAMDNLCENNFIKTVCVQLRYAIPNRVRESNDISPASIVHISVSRMQVTVTIKEYKKGFQTG